MHKCTDVANIPVALIFLTIMSCRNVADLSTHDLKGGIPAEDVDKASSPAIPLSEAPPTGGDVGVVKEGQ